MVFHKNYLKFAFRKSKRMKNVYHSDIMQLLLLKGKEGMHVSQVSRMVYNLHTNLFDHQINYYDLHRTIRMYLWRQSQMRRSPFMRVSYGTYAIKSDVAIQLDFCFDEPLDIPAPSALKPNSHTENDPRQLTLF